MPRFCFAICPGKVLKLEARRIELPTSYVQSRNSNHLSYASDNEREKTGDGIRTHDKLAICQLLFQTELLLYGTFIILAEIKKVSIVYFTMLILFYSVN